MVKKNLNSQKTKKKYVKFIVKEKVLTQDKLEELEKYFKKNMFLSRKETGILSYFLELNHNLIDVWFYEKRQDFFLHWNLYRFRYNGDPVYPSNNDLLIRKCQYFI